MLDNLKFEDIPAFLLQQQEQLTRIEMMIARPTEPSIPNQFGVAGFHAYLRSLGLPMSPSLQQKLTASGKIPCHKFNNKLVFKRDEIDAWIERQISPNCKVTGKGDAALTLAKSANRKMKGGKTA